jgi:hypothetical protein
MRGDRVSFCSGDPAMRDHQHLSPRTNGTQKLTL